MKELELKYGCNPNQKPARVFVTNGDLPFEVLSGRPGYINLLDALNGWQLVSELRSATGLPAAASFKHVSPAGAALGIPMSDVLKRAYRVDDLSIDGSLLACAYARARGADRMSSFGDFIALSDVCDVETARIIKREVSDGIIAPDYSPEALELLRQKRGGKYNILRIDPNYRPNPMEQKQVFGVYFEQLRNEIDLADDTLFSNIPTKLDYFKKKKKRDLKVALIILKYTQSNSVCYVKDGQAIGIGAGQQSRIHCTRLAGDKADKWWLRQHPAILDLQFKANLGRAERDNATDVLLGEHPEDVCAPGLWEQSFDVRPTPLTSEERNQWLSQLNDVCLGSDAFFPFGDNIERAARSGVKYVAQAGGSVRDDNVIETCNLHGITMAFTGVRLFHH